MSAHDDIGGDGDQVPRDLSTAEVRVLGCLIEKSATTPDNYPLTLNALRNACNQSTSRDPVVDYSDLDVERALGTLRERGLTRTVHSTSNRATKYRHVAADVMFLDERESALMSVLMLRGPQTVGELKSRSERQFVFVSTDEVAAVLSDLAGRPQPLVERRDRQPGQKDARWTHLLSPADPVDEDEHAAERGGGNRAVADVTHVADPYGEAAAEFYDLLATDMWDEFGMQLLELLAGVDASVGPLVDIGCGTGVGLVALHAAVPGVRVLAVEPSKAMRTALHVRLAADAALRASTTVVPMTLAETSLPEHACAVVVSAAYGHLDDVERHKLWTYVADHLGPGAPVVIGVLPPDRPIDVPLVRYRRLAVGEQFYEGWQEGSPVDERTMRWTLVYKVLDSHDDVVVEHRVSSLWRCDGADDIRREIEPYGLVLVEHDECVVVTKPA